MLTLGFMFLRYYRQSVTFNAAAHSLTYSLDSVSAASVWGHVARMEEKGRSHALCPVSAVYLAEYPQKAT